MGRPSRAFFFFSFLPFLFFVVVADVATVRAHVYFHPFMFYATAFIFYSAHSVVIGVWLILALSIYLYYIFFFIVYILVFIMLY